MSSTGVSRGQGGIFWQRTSPDRRWVLIVEEVGRKVCYAYLRARKLAAGANPIAAEVWLYNLKPAPKVPEWTLPGARDLLPFLNAVDFVMGDGTLHAVEPELLDVEWSEAADGSVIADLLLDGTHLARLVPGSKPGWSRLARHKNEIAIPLDEAPTPA